VRLVYKINLAVFGLLAVSSLLVGSFFSLAYRDLRDETYRWFDANARTLGLTIGNQARESIAYFDYTTIEQGLRKRVGEDPNLLYASVSFGENRKERREAGNPAAGPHRRYDVEIRDESKPVAGVTIHYATAGVEGKLGALVTRLAVGSGVTLLLLLGTLYALVRRLVSRPLALILRHAEVTAAGEDRKSTRLNSSHRL